MQTWEVGLLDIGAYSQFGLIIPYIHLLTLCASLLLIYEANPHALFTTARLILHSLPSSYSTFHLIAASVFLTLHMLFVVLEALPLRGLVSFYPMKSQLQGNQLELMPSSVNAPFQNFFH